MRVLFLQVPHLPAIFPELISFHLPGIYPGIIALLLFAFRGQLGGGRALLWKPQNPPGFFCLPLRRRSNIRLFSGKTVFPLFARRLVFSAAGAFAGPGYGYVFQGFLPVCAHVFFCIIIAAHLSFFRFAGVAFGFFFAFCAFPCRRLSNGKPETVYSYRRTFYAFLFDGKHLFSWFFQPVFTAFAKQKAVLGRLAAGKTKFLRFLLFALKGHLKGFIALIISPFKNAFAAFCFSLFWGDFKSRFLNCSSLWKKKFCTRFFWRQLRRYLFV